MKRIHLVRYVAAAVTLVSIVRGQEVSNVGDVLKRAVALEIPSSGYQVERTVAEAMRKALAPNAVIIQAPQAQALHKGSLKIYVSRASTETTPGWFRLQLSPDGTGELTASHTHLLYTAFCHVRDEWEKKLSLEFILGLVNSTLMNFFHDSMRVKATDLHPQILVSNLKKLPIRIASNDEQDAISSLVKKILAMKQRDPDADTTPLEREIDQLVYKLYGLTQEEIAIVEGNK